MGGSLTVSPIVKRLYCYRNGNYFVTIYEDGTKTRQNTLDFFKPKYPESLDIKITNKCDLGCPWCHESSVKNGEHCDSKVLLQKLSNLPRGVEIAIGGGNPFEHPDLHYILACLKHFGLICNITFNEHHFEQYSYLIQEFINENLIYGYGISCERSYSIAAHKIMYEFCSSDGACVIPHLIAGINTVDDILDSIKIYGKCLILGYKEYGRGKPYVATPISKEIRILKRSLSDILQHGIVSFDNLAIEQLNVKDYLTSAQWDEMYMGDDGDFSIYYDAVEDVFKKNSISTKQIQATDACVAFNTIKKGDRKCPTN